MPNDDNDLDTVLLGGDYHGDSDSFDPFSTSSGEDDREDRADTFGFNTDAEPDDREGILRYGGSSGEGGEGIPTDDNGPLPWTRGTEAIVAGAVEQRERERVDAGNRHVGRVAEEHGRSHNPGTGRGTVPPRLASSIGDAQQRIKASLRGASEGNLDVGGIATRIAAYEESGGRAPPPAAKRTYEKSQVLTPPQFQRTQFEAIIQKLQSNADGSWQVTIRVPPFDREAATILGDAYGLALDVTIIRKRFSPDAD